jgi:hypothetical protein
VRHNLLRAHGLGLGLGLQLRLGLRLVVRNSEPAVRRYRHAKLSRLRRRQQKRCAVVG